MPPSGPGQTWRKHESVAVLSADHRQPRRDRAGHGGHEPGLLSAHAGELTEQIKLGDELGYDSVSFTEHHFHIEGFELSNNPVLLDLYFAMQTKRIRVGQLGIVLPASIRSVSPKTSPCSTI